MKPHWVLAAVIASGWAGWHWFVRPQARPPSVEIGGVRLGMSPDEYRSIASTAPGFRIGPVRSDGVPQAVFVDDRLASFQWKFSTGHYELVRTTMRDQYPQMRCTNTGVGGREVCSIGRTLFLWQGQGGGWNSQVTLQGDARDGRR